MIPPQPQSRRGWRIRRRTPPVEEAGPPERPWGWIVAFVLAILITLVAPFWDVIWQWLSPPVGSTVL